MMRTLRLRGEIVCGPYAEFVHGGHQRCARRRERIGDRDRWACLHFADDDSRNLQFAQSLSKNGIADAFDATTEFGKSERTVREGAQYDANPAFPEESKRTDEGLIAGGRLGAARVTWDFVPFGASGGHCFRLPVTSVN